MGRVESQGRNEQRPVGRHPASSKHFYFCLIGFWVGGGVLTRTPTRQRKRREGISGCGGERGERACREEEGRERERRGGEVGCNNRHAGKDN